MDVACDCDALCQIELAAKQNDADLESMKRSSIGSKLLSPVFSTPRAFSFGTKPFIGDNEWKPKFLQYCKESCRLKSFGNWPKQMNPKPEQLAKAGFFYEGVSDTCHCFFCGLLVHNWETEDNAIEEHFRHSPKCHYVEFHM